MWFVQLVHFKNRDIISFVLTPKNPLYNDLLSSQVLRYLNNVYPDYEIEQIIRIAGWKGEKKA